MSSDLTALERAVEEARDNAKQVIRLYTRDNPLDHDDLAAIMDEVDKAILAVRLAERHRVREAVERVKGLTATVSAYSHWSDAEERPRTVDAELEGVYFIRRSDALAAIDALPETP
jgi:hypothetical protein